LYKRGNTTGCIKGAIEHRLFNRAPTSRHCAWKDRQQQNYCIVIITFAAEEDTPNIGIIIFAAEEDTRKYRHYNICCRRRYPQI